MFQFLLSSRLLWRSENYIYGISFAISNKWSRMLMYAVRWIFPKVLMLFARLWFKREWNLFSSDETRTILQLKTCLFQQKNLVYQVLWDNVRNYKVETNELCGKALGNVFHSPPATYPRPPLSLQSITLFINNSLFNDISSSNKQQEPLFKI